MGCEIWGGGYGMWDKGYWMRGAGYGMWDKGYGIRGAGYGMCNIGYGVWDIGYGMRDEVYGILDLGCRIGETPAPQLTLSPNSPRNSRSTWCFSSAGSCDKKNSGREMKNTQNIYQTSSFESDFRHLEN